MSEIRDKVRGDIAVIITSLIDNRVANFGKLFPTADIFSLVDQILKSIPELAIVDRGAELPLLTWDEVKGTAVEVDTDTWAKFLVMMKVQLDRLLKAGWVKEANDG